MKSKTSIKHTFCRDFDQGYYNNFTDDQINDFYFEVV